MLSFLGDVKLLTDDMKVLKPSLFPVVPRLLSRLYDVAQTQLNNPFKRALFNVAYWFKAREMKEGTFKPLIMG